LGLFQVRPTDPPTLIAVAAVLLGAALVASLVPALRAAGTDPLTVIRAE
jgi:putative ABC transport system permease protein